MSWFNGAMIGLHFVIHSSKHCFISCS